MEVHITSNQMVKPSSSKLHLFKPFKISLLDQLTPGMYTPVLLFYAKPSDSNIHSSQFADQLKQSLSKALTQFYPAAGRVKNNLFITNFDEGVPYVETKVKGRLSDFIEPTQKLEAMNRLLPCRPFCYIQDSTTAPQLAVQVNIFHCGGIAIGLCVFHKIFDGATLSAFLNSWAAFSRGSNGEIPNPGLLGSSSRLFPPIESMPENADWHSMFFNYDRRMMSRTYVFDANAISTLKLKVKSKSLEHPSRALALTAFIWKHVIQASRSASGTLKPAILCQPVNLRPRLKPILPSYSIGNLFLTTYSMYNPVGKDIDLSELGYLLRQATKSAPNDPQIVLQGFKTMTEQLDHLVEMVSKGNADLFVLSSLINTLDANEDFGWGKGTLLGIPGIDSHNRELCNSFFIKNARQHNAIEVWVTVPEKEIDFLERDPEFLAFASPNSYFDRSKI
ncbi:putative Cysteine-rich RLK (RECEPTOR-like protein kinase) 8 [Hibiscus syriacus]|uniref:Cysteine-rich RLK (RECEPTOR-like protein kinase) 8 n=1 Tax=Hibiscus syriacus TaxID=106335 RepID=A0A6A2Y2S7_HIBSY|nr:stemmadenine O-acetyltransferase-like [Hibiscus syriacus]KAE8669816.1 putative Cysteine-rich RLK (RECEPTOR-like protein kinase) 8 [Hibiscus syriacus]